VTVGTGLAALGCFGAVDLVAVGTDLPLLLDTMLLVAATICYLALVWVRRRALGFDAFRQVLRRRVGTPRHAGRLVRAEG
jgi:hypothetical protein